MSETTKRNKGEQKGIKFAMIMIQDSSVKPKDYLDYLHKRIKVLKCQNRIKKDNNLFRNEEHLLGGW